MSNMPKAHLWYTFHFIKVRKAYFNMFVIFALKETNLKPLNGHFGMIYKGIWFWWSCGLRI